MKTQTLHFHPKSETFKTNASDALADAPLRKSLRTAMDGLMAKRKAVLSDEHELQSLRDLCEHIRQRSLAQLPELLTQLENKLTQLGVQVHWAENSEQACAIIHAIMTQKNGQLMVKGKSMVREEIELNHYLADQGIEAVESTFGQCKGCELMNMRAIMLNPLHSCRNNPQARHVKRNIDLFPEPYLWKTADDL